MIDATPAPIGADALRAVIDEMRSKEARGAEATEHELGEMADRLTQALDQYDAALASAAQPAAPAAQGDALGSHDVREPTAIGRAVNRAARDLPEGWEIRIDLERHAGVVFLIDPDGNETMSEGGELFSDQINAAIDAARAAKEGA